MNEEIRLKIEQIIQGNDILLFMKGNKLWPQCGFSAKALDILNFHGADYETFDILQDEEVRQGLKIYSNWPTFPQLYIKGALIGGYDIMKEMHEAGELATIIK